ncbi:unnamed protein product [Closterium sp. NIES-65]|nr:unnamed protein product [Closterium sp. NIES-65]
MVYVCVQALVNVGRELSLEVSGRVSTEVDPRLAHNTAAMVDRVRNLAELYKEVDVGVNRVLFKLPATWEGIEAARHLEAEGIKTHVTGVASFAQVSACAQANVAVIQIPVGRIKDWARTHSGDKEVEAAAAKGEDPGVSLVRRACAFIARNNFPTKVMASNIRSKEDALSLHGTDYLVVPLKVMEALKDTPASPDLKPAALSSAADKVKPWDMARFMANIGPCARQLLQAEIDSAVSQAEKVDKHFKKIWPPPNVSETEQYLFKFQIPSLLPYVRFPIHASGASHSHSLKPIPAAAGHASAFSSQGNTEGKEGKKSNGAGDSPVEGVREGEGEGEEKREVEGVGKEGEEVEEEMGESVAAARVRVRHELYAPIEPYRSGTLAVSDVHTVYWEESGNPKGQPVIFLHGGPGGGTSPANRRFFDPTFFRIILLDQRGAGRSTPHACLEENTTWHLVEDIETLRKHLGVDKWLVFGGSWGSTLSLVYAATHPDRVAGLILRGIFLLRRKEVEWFYQKGADSIFPDAFDKYREFIPKDEQQDLVTAYHKRLMNDSDPDQQVAAARHWTEWEMATSYLLPNEDSLKRGEDDKFALAFARIESHYFVNKGFLPADSFLLDSVPKFRHIPAVIVQGRYDVVCPIVSAWELHKAWPEAEFKIVPDAGHSANEKGISEQLVAAMESFKLKLSR